MIYFYCGKIDSRERLHIHGRVTSSAVSQSKILKTHIRRQEVKIYLINLFSVMLNIVLCSANTRQPYTATKYWESFNDKGWSNIIIPWLRLM